MNNIAQGLRVPPPPPGWRPGMPGVGQNGHVPAGPIIQQQLPIRPAVNSTRISDLTPKAHLDEAACKKKLTTYEAHTIRKVAPKDPKEKATWGRVEFVKEPLLSDDIAKAVKALSEESKKSVSDKKAALYPYQQAQVTKLLDDLNTSEIDRHFVWSLAQIHRKERHVKGSKPETVLITVYVKRCVIDSVSALAIYNALERNKAERMAALAGPPRPAPTAAAPGITIIDASKERPTIVHKASSKRSGRDGHSSVSSEFYTDSESDSDYSSIGTSISSRSARRYRKNSHGHRPRSHSRHRDHVKTYYITQRPSSPPPRRKEYYSSPTISYASPIRDLPRAVPAIDPVSAAYIAGKVDADAERLERERYGPTSTASRYDRGSEPRAVVSYDGPGRRYRDYYFDGASRRHFDDRRLMEERRYEDRRFDQRYGARYHGDNRSSLLSDPFPVREELRRREAEDYIDHGSRVFEHPFRPRAHPRYSGSSISGW